MKQGINEECGEHSECSEKFRTLKWMIGVLVSISIVGSGFMVSAAVTASRVSTQLELLKADYTSQIKMVEQKYTSEVSRLNSEIAQTKADTNKDLINAITKIGLEQSAANETILRLAQTNQQRLQDTQETLKTLAEKVDEIKQKVK